MITLENYTLSIQKSISMNTNTKRSWIINIILIIYFLKHDYDVWLKIKNRLIQLLEKVKKKKKESVDLSDMLSLEGDEEVKERKGLKLQKNY